MSPQRSEFGHPRRWPTARYYRPLSENSMITRRAKPRFERSRTNRSDNITLHHHFRCEVDDCRYGRAWDVKPSAMKVANAQKA
jgi:hypothetical protein